MSGTKITRREVLGTIGKTGIGLSTAPLFFLSLNTSPLPQGRWTTSLESGQLRPRRKPVPAKAVNEKVVISGHSSKITLKISGRPGRHCGLAYAVSNTRQSYKAVPGGRGVIGRNGTCIIEIPTASLPNGKVFLRVVTGGTKDFAQNARGSRAFTVEISQGRISSFSGVRERALDNAVAVASVAAACYAAKGR